MAEEILDKKGIIKAITIATVVALIGIAVLGWLYHQRFSVIEQDLEEQKETIERGAAQDVLRQFMLARIGQDEHIAKLRLTEKAMEQMRLNEFFLIDNFDSYEILESEKLAEDQYRFTVKIYYEELPIELIEIITLIKIKILELDSYYVDSVQIAG
jgi:hypothetical protein